MKKLAILIGLVALAAGVRAQVYTTSDLQMIFSWASVTENGQEIDGPLRWSPVFNFGTNVHFDPSDRIGFYTGLNIKNIGFIANTSVGKQVHRTYSLGIPVSIKVGNMTNKLVYAGYEFELPFHYKVKSWEESDRKGTKSTYKAWFSDATPSTMHSLHVGLQLSGINVKFKYYLNEFLNQDYVRDGEMPNQGLEAQVYSLSIVASLLRNTKFYYVAD